MKHSHIKYIHNLISVYTVGQHKHYFRFKSRRNIEQERYRAYAEWKPITATDQIPENIKEREEITTEGQKDEGNESETEREREKDK